MLTQAPKGTRDILPNEIYKWQYIQHVISHICENFGYKEIRIPVFEHTELFERGVGDTTDIVQKEMYTFLDKGGRSITLRPEGTAGVVRSYIENGMASLVQPLKLYYTLTAYRYENVQKGRYREFNQFGVEAFGSSSPDMDVEVISMVSMLLDKLGITDVQLNINSIGCPKCRQEYNEKLKDHIKPILNELCDTCKVRYDKNVLRILDCKDEKCKKLVRNSPALIDNLCDECNAHFKKLQSGLSNLNIKFNINSNIVRGLDYYTKTVFEFISNKIGAQGTVCGGGRYDGLVEDVGGKSTPAIGFAMGIERLLLVMDSYGINIPSPRGTDIFIATLGEDSVKLAQKIVYQLRNFGINAEMDLMYRSLKAQMKYADKLESKYSLVIGDDELKCDKAILKNMTNKEQREVILSRITDELKELL